MTDGRMKQLLVYGAGGFGREIVWLAQCCKDCEVIGFVDDDPKWHGSRMNDVPVISLEDALKSFPDASVVVAIGSPQTREKICDKLAKAGLKSDGLVHPGTQMSSWIDLEAGTVICAGCILTTNITIGNQVQINLVCTIGHDVVMGDYTTLAPGVHVSGYVHFGKRVYVGTGAVFINGTRENPLVIGNDVIIGAGACVTHSVTCGTWGGVPARELAISRP
ncbi:MAG: acetyltransferase [Desulfamplus sp.]|nr:acetyltransferase [Desulfamplus sp.]